jgi:23S rRNA (uracil1939-C5)-methyltransferase
MRRSKFKPYTVQHIAITNAGSEGKSVARHEDKVILVDHAVPGDIADLQITSSKKSFSFARIAKLVQPSPDRIEPFCSHFGVCGGCKWQHMTYEAQLRYKQQQVLDAFQRIGKFPFPSLEPIIGSSDTTYYRNKLEFTFTDRKWLESIDDKETMSSDEHFGLGFHIPGRFDKVLDIRHCYLQPDPSNAIRLAIKEFAIQHRLPFFNVHSQEGFLRNIIIRNSILGELMLIVVFREDIPEKRNALLEHLKVTFPQITSLLYIINEKMNDTVHDLDPVVYAGNDHIREQLEDLVFKIGAKSFFQTNTKQTLQLYSKARDFAGLTGNEHVYDLYTGVGTIANFVAKRSKKVIGVEYVAQAIEDAKANAALNGITNTEFFAGDMKDVLNDTFIATHGKPDVIITDPPRAGMHESVVAKLLELKAKRVVYISCNPATQARDMAMMDAVYDVKKVQPVDMFPHTHHVENIALLELKPGN